MTKFAHSSAPDPSPDGSSRGLWAKAGDLLPLLDLFGLVLCAYLGLIVSSALQPATLEPASWSELSRLVWVAAALGPFMLYEPHFARFVAGRDNASLIRGFLRRFLLLAMVAGAFSLAGGLLKAAPFGWLVAWLSLTLLFGAAMRMILIRAMQRFPRRGINASTRRHALVGDHLSVTLLADRPIRYWKAMVKQGLDYLMSFIITLLLLPVLAAIALAIRIDSAGPILFKQRRHGYNNREFDIYKFRTMRVLSAAPGQDLQQTVRGDPRVTRIGRFLRKWSLDELPQVFNVLAGDMSLVGPRPHAVNMRTSQRYGHEITDTYPHRHRVKPGITGWAQINGSRGATDTVEQLRRRVELDLYYVDHWSPLLDLKILALTSREVLRATNAF